jgi:hypothetical protein
MKDKSIIQKTINLLIENSEFIYLDSVSKITGLSRSIIRNNIIETQDKQIDNYNWNLSVDRYINVNENEFFINIPEHPGYKISNQGRILSIKNRTPIILKTSPIKEYLCSTLSVDGKKSNINKVHQFMAIAFLNHIPNGNIIVVDHINGIKTDNRLENLRLVTNRQNTSLGYAKKSTASKYVGVTYGKNNKNKWIAHIRIGSKRIYLGCFATEEEAYQAYEKALNKL